MISNGTFTAHEKIWGTYHCTTSISSYPTRGPSHPPIPPVPVQPLPLVPPQPIAGIHAQMAALPLQPMRRYRGPTILHPIPSAGPSQAPIPPSPAHSSHDMVASIHAQMAALPLQPVRRHMGPPTIPPQLQAIAPAAQPPPPPELPQPPLQHMAPAIPRA